MFSLVFSNSSVVRSIYMESKQAVSFPCVLTLLLHECGEQEKERVME